LHDIGHGPFSHTLENIIIPGLRHEAVSLTLMNRLNEEFNGRLDLAIAIFKGNYKKQFLHQLVSSQIDVDRLDYLTRDSFHTGVSEGIIGLERILQMLHVVDDKLVVEEKGIYSIEKFIIARRLMYWQVYLHKTTLAADSLLLNILKRAREVDFDRHHKGISEPLRFFLKEKIPATEFLNRDQAKENFVRMDDHDVYSAIKYWANSEDVVLSHQSSALLMRKLPKVALFSDPIDLEPYKFRIASEKSKYPKFTEDDLAYLIYSGVVKNEVYADGNDSIQILKKDGSLHDIVKASDNYNISAMKQVVEKYYVCTPK
jgi:HD superfamily phosphohydrolase